MSALAIALLVGALAPAAQAAVPVDVAAAVDAARGLDLPALEARAAGADWVVALGAEAALARSRSPALVAELEGLLPAPTRSGALRFTAPSVREHDATAPLLVRLAAGADTAPVRVALVDAAMRSGGDWAGPMAELARIETDAEVRRMMVEVLARAPGAVAQPALAAALVDLDPAVRAAGARAVSAHDDGAGLDDALVALVADPSAEVRVEACRGLGWHGVRAGWDALVGAVADNDPAVRLRALRALQRIDPAAAAALPAVQAATADGDAKVARAAGQIVGG